MTHNPYKENDPMRKSTLILAALLVAFALIVPAIAGPNILASGEIVIPAGALVKTTNSATIGMYNIDGQEWAEVVGVRVVNESLWTNITTFYQTDLGVSTAFIAVTNTEGAAANGNVAGSVAYALKVYSGTNDAAIYTNTAYYQSPPAYVREVTVTVVTPSNLATASTNKYLIFGR